MESLALKNEAEFLLSEYDTLGDLWGEIENITPNVQDPSHTGAQYLVSAQAVGGSSYLPAHAKHSYGRAVGGGGVTVATRHQPQLLHWPNAGGSLGQVSYFRCHGRWERGAGGGRRRGGGNRIVIFLSLLKYIVFLEASS